MSLIKRLNTILFGVIMLSIICVAGVFVFAAMDNKKVNSANDVNDKRGVFEFRKGLSGKINLGAVNGVNITKHDIANVSFIKEGDKQGSEFTKEKALGSLIFIGGELESDGSDKELIQDTLRKLSQNNSDPAILTGNLINFKKNEKRVSGRILDIKKTLSSSFDKFNISFGEGDIACGDDCINGWGEVLFGEKIETRDLLFAHSFTFINSKILLLEPDFFSSEEELKMSWLEKELKENDKDNLIVVSHDSMPGFDGGSVGVARIEDIGELKSKKLFEKYGVDLVVFGDKNRFFYGKSGDVMYVSSANFKENLVNDEHGVSFFKLSLGEKEMYILAYNKEQELVDELKVK